MPIDVVIVARPRGSRGGGGGRGRGGRGGGGVATEVVVAADAKRSLT